jgi:hypothetical protein
VNAADRRRLEHDLEQARAEAARWRRVERDAAADAHRAEGAMSDGQRAYLDAICLAYQESASGPEEMLAEQLLVAACRRLGLSDEDVFAEWSARVYIPTVFDEPARSLCTACHGTGDVHDRDEAGPTVEPCDRCDDGFVDDDGEERALGRARDREIAESVRGAR